MLVSLNDSEHADAIKTYFIAVRCHHIPALVAFVMHQPSVEGTGTVIHLSEGGTFAKELPCNTYLIFIRFNQIKQTIHT